MTKRVTDKEPLMVAQSVVGHGSANLWNLLACFLLRRISDLLRSHATVEQRRKNQPADTQKTSDSASPSLMFASSSIFCTRFRSLELSPISCRLRRMTSLSSRIVKGGIKLGRIIPCLRRWASHRLSFGSVLCPRLFCTSAAFARITRTRASSRLKTGFQ
jgi:hypothetical protein